MNDIVLIAGTGIAASASAVRLIDAGLRPVLLSSRRPSLPGAEAIPESGIRLLAKLRLESAVQAAGGVLVEGFDNRQPYLHVERSRLAAALLRIATHRGARLVECAAIPQLQSRAGEVRADRHSGIAALDATGRSAVWSRPLGHSGRQVADLYRVHRSGSARPGQVVEVKGGWAYVIGVPGEITIGLLTRRGAPRMPFTREIASSLDLALSDCQFLGRRPAFVQWAESPIADRRIAIGDAALAHDPVSGQGVTFALASAIGAIEVITGWHNSDLIDTPAARSYRKFVDQALERHLSLRAELNRSSLRADQVD